LLSQQESSQEWQQFLSEKGYYQDINTLRKKIKEKKALLAESRAQDLQYQFTKLDIPNVLNSLSYVNWAQKLSIPNVKKFASSTKQIVEIYVKRYCEFLQGHVQYYSNISVKLQTKDPSDIFGGKNIFQECQLLFNFKFLAPLILKTFLKISMTS